MATYGTLVKGGADEIIVEITDSDGWDAGAVDWTWSLLLGAAASKNTQAVIFEAIEASISGNVLTATYIIDDDDSAALADGMYYVEVQAVEDDVDETVHYFDVVSGTLTVRKPYGAEEDE